jgi:hypothetical protein
MSAVDEGTSLQENNVVTGVYDLVTAAGRDLPVVVSENSTTGYKQEIVGGSVTRGEHIPLDDPVSLHGKRQSDHW